MRVLMRKTLTGNEYWDTEEKKTLFVPIGKDPDFEVTVNPTSMIGEATHETGTKVAEALKSVGDGIDLDDLDTEQLLAIAEQSGIDVPGNMKKEDTIRNYINDALTATDDE